MATKTEIRNEILAIDPNAKLPTTMAHAALAMALVSYQATQPDLALDTQGNEFATDFDMSAAFSWNQMQDEQHAPSDLLSNYPEPFQAEIMKLRGMTDVKIMKQFGKWAFDHLKPAVSAKAWNYWCIDYRQKQTELTPPITDHGKVLLLNAVNKLKACTAYDQVKALGAYWYNLQDTGKLESEFGMNSTEIDALWKEYAIIKKNWESMTAGLGFTGSPF